MKNKNFKIISSLLIAFLITKILSTSIFDQKTPKINPFFFSNLKNFLKKRGQLFSKKSSEKKQIIPSPSLFFNKNKKSTFEFEKISRPPIPSLKITINKKITITNTPTSILIPSLSHPTITVFASPTKIPTFTSTPQKQISSKISGSKLGVFILVSYTKGAETILNSGPRIIKFIDPQNQPEFMEAVKKYKQNFPQGIIVLRFWNGTSGLKYTLDNDPIQAADDFFSRVNQPAFSILGDNISYFDYLQTPNEFETTPEWWGREKTIWNGKFWRKLTELNKNAGIKTCIGGIPVGNVEAQDLGYIIDDLRVIKNLGGAFCYHGYTFEYSTDVGREIQLSLRYRQFYNFFQNNAPDLMSMPLILSEGGVAEGGNPYGGYLASQNIEKYKNWLRWFDSEIKKDSYVIGVTLFQIGNTTDWANFNLEPIADWLAEYLRSN